MLVKHTDVSLILFHVSISKFSKNVKVDKERRRGRLKRVLLPPSAPLTQKDFRDRVGLVELGQRESEFDPNQDENIGRYRTSSQELQEMVKY